MFGARASSVLASGILLLGSSAIALAQAGGPPEELPPEAAQEAQDDVSTLELGNETATNAVDDRGLGADSDGDDATEFSEWVRNLNLDGCERGLTIAANAQNGPTAFTEADAVEADPDHPAIQAGCNDPDQHGFSEQNGADGGEEFGRETAEQNSSGASDNEVDGEDAGPPSDAGPPAGSNAPDGAGPPADRGR